MAKMVISIIIEGNPSTLSKVRTKVLKVAHKVLISSSCYKDEPKPTPKKCEFDLEV